MNANYVFTLSSGKNKKNRPKAVAQRYITKDSNFQLICSDHHKSIISFSNATSTISYFDESLFDYPFQHRSFQQEM